MSDLMVLPVIFALYGVARGLNYVADAVDRSSRLIASTMQELGETEHDKS